MGPLLAIFAHPDDETFTAAGVLAAAVERGIPVTVITATRGEAGESAIAGLNDPERLGIIRERELGDAMRRIGVNDVRFLGYRDSGMEGSPEAEHSRAFVRVAPETAAAELVTYIREIRPQTVITFGPDGVYGHPDHRHVHEAVTLAVPLAADPNHKGRANSEPWQIDALYFATFPREVMLAMFDFPGNPLESLPPETRANLGVPLAEITHVVDISPWSERKRASISAHRTQTGEGGPLREIPPDLIAMQLSREHFVRARLPWSTDENADEDIIEVLSSTPASG
jgi:LmbE family N-acetylglucosaminyl deacetylase